MQEKLENFLCNIKKQIPVGIPWHRFRTSPKNIKATECIILLWIAKLLKWIAVWLPFYSLVLWFKQMWIVRWSINVMRVQKVQLNQTIFETGVMETLTKSQNSTVLDQGVLASTQRSHPSGFCIWCCLFGDNGYSPFKSTTKN